MEENVKELVNKALDYDKQACLELAAWYREQGNTGMAGLELSRDKVSLLKKEKKYLKSIHKL